MDVPGISWGGAAWCRWWTVSSPGPELIGGNGIPLEKPLGPFVADSEAIYSYEGTREINTLIVGRAITGLGAFV